MKRHRSIPALAAGFAFAGCCAYAMAEPTLLPANTSMARTMPQNPPSGTRVVAALKAIKLPPGFRISLFAYANDARGLAVSEDGRKVFVGTNGEQVYVLDLGGPGGPVKSVKMFAPSIAKRMPHGVCFGPDKTLYLVELNRILAFADAAAQSGSRDLAARVVVPKGKLIPASFESETHASRACRVGPDGALYVTVGQPTNVPTREKWETFSKEGLGVILRMKTDGSQRTIYAGGIRNSVGLDFDPRDGKLWFTDNQVDMMGDDIPPGEINRADKPGQTFGFPWYGGGHVRTQEWKASTPPADSVFPLVETQAHAADLGMIFYRGSAFPERYRGGIFSAQHGSWNRSKPVGAQVMFTPVGGDGVAGKPEVFATGWLTADGHYTGRPAEIAELKDGSLLVSDDGTGVIYRISVTR